MAEADLLDRTYFAAHMDECESVDLGRWGDAVVFSRGAPDKDSANEDAALLVAAASNGVVILVADGMGGRPGGEDASKTLAREIQRCVRATEPGDVRAAILDAIENANRKILEAGNGSATTLAAVEIAGPATRPTARAYHVGDSQIVVVGNRGKVKLQTVPHSPVGFGVEAGLIDEDEALHHDDRHVVSNMVGASDMRMEVGSPMRLSAMDTVVIASDGLFDNLSVDEVTELVRKGPLAAAARRLVELASERMNGTQESKPSKPDDLTFILFRLPARKK
jgi:serine/threonine protein phosphatase PrpC